jgi:hypothetical protein
MALSVVQGAWPWTAKLPQAMSVMDIQAMDNPTLQQQITDINLGITPSPTLAHNRDLLHLLHDHLSIKCWHIMSFDAPWPWHPFLLSSFKTLLSLTPEADTAAILAHPSVKAKMAATPSYINAIVKDPAVWQLFVKTPLQDWPKALEEVRASLPGITSESSLFTIAASLRNTHKLYLRGAHPDTHQDLDLSTPEDDGHEGILPHLLHMQLLMTENEKPNKRRRTADTPDQSILPLTNTNTTGDIQLWSRGTPSSAFAMPPNLSTELRKAHKEEVTPTVMEEGTFKMTVPKDTNNMNLLITSVKNAQSKLEQMKLLQGSEILKVVMQDLSGVSPLISNACYARQFQLGIIEEAATALVLEVGCTEGAATIVAMAVLAGNFTFSLDLLLPKGLNTGDKKSSLGRMLKAGTPTSTHPMAAMEPSSMDTFSAFQITWAAFQTGVQAIFPWVSHLEFKTVLKDMRDQTMKGMPISVVDSHCLFPLLNEWTKEVKKWLRGTTVTSTSFPSLGDIIQLKSSFLKMETLQNSMQACPAYPPPPYPPCSAPTPPTHPTPPSPQKPKDQPGGKGKDGKGAKGKGNTYVDPADRVMGHFEGNKFKGGFTPPQLMEEWAKFTGVTDATAVQETKCFNHTFRENGCKSSYCKRRHGRVDEAQARKFIAQVAPSA